MKMKPSHIPIYNVKTTSLKVLLAIAFILGFFGLTGIIDQVFFNHSLKITNSIFFSVFLVFQSSISAFLVYQGFKNSKYFVAWNENEFNYLLPKNKQMETVPVNEIESIDFEKHIIKITLKNGEQKHFNLNYLFLPKRRQVSEYFQAIKNQTENKSQ